MKRTDLKNWNNKKYWLDYSTTIMTMINRMYSKDVDKELVIPEYQRDYVWKDGNAPKLLLSLYKGYPIGNIVIWSNDSDKDGNLSLIDGLQRYMTILRLYEKPFNFISFNLYKYWLRKEGMVLFEFEDNIHSEKESFRHLRSSMHHKNKEYKASYKEDAIKFVNETNSKCFNEKIKDRFLSFINDYYQWHKNKFTKINVPHYIIDKMSSKEVSEVFELINITGTKLTRFEVASANWSRYKINIDEEIDYIKKFNDARIEKYKKNFEDDKKVGNHLINYGNKKIIPSNFLYSIFYEVFKDDNELKHTFIDSKNEYSVVSKSIEPLCEVVMHILINDFKSREFEFDDLGKELNYNIKTKADVDKLRIQLKNSFNKVKNNIKWIKLARIGGINKFPKYPVWLLATFAIYYINGINSKYFKDWFINELLFDNRLASSTGTKARDIIKNNEFENEIEITSKQILDYIEKESFILKPYDSREKAVILAMVQKENRTPSTDNQIDHFLPQSKLRGKVKNIDTIWNLQYLESSINGEKNNEIIETHYEYDVYSKYYTDKEKEELRNLFSKLMMALDKEDNNEKINELFNKIIEIRKKIIISNSTFLNDNSNNTN